MNEVLHFYPCGAGAKNKGCADGPKALLEGVLQQGLLDSLMVDDSFPVSMIGGAQRDIIHHYCQHLAQRVQETITQGLFPITIGGDHSMAVGTWSGVIAACQAQQQFGLLWVDAHMDAHTSATSPSGAYHGMPLATLLGAGEENLVNLIEKGPKISPEHVVLIGVRSYEREEADYLNSLGVRIFFMDEIRTRGLEIVIQEAKAIVVQAKSGFGISIDIDALDPEIAPGAGSLEPNGLYLKELTEILGSFSQEEKFCALEIAEFNPHCDKGQHTAKIIKMLVQQCHNRRI